MDSFDILVLINLLCISWFKVRGYELSRIMSDSYQLCYYKVSFSMTIPNMT